MVMERLRLAFVKVCPHIPRFLPSALLTSLAIVVSPAKFKALHFSTITVTLVAFSRIKYYPCLRAVTVDSGGMKIP
jgi:hypothetical protein